MILKLDETNLREGTKYIAERDESMAMVLEKYGYPPLWSRTPGFSTMAHIILEQQVSLASANAAFARLKAQLGGEVTASGFLALNDIILREIGYSKQKINYTRHLAEGVTLRGFSFESLENADYDYVKQALIQFKGIGEWTADVYISECLLRPDVLPKGDIALLEAFKRLKGLDSRPEHTVLEAMTEHWRPWRSVGIRMLWHYYLNAIRPIQV